MLQHIKQSVSGTKNKTKKPGSLFLAVCLMFMSGCATTQDMDAVNNSIIKMQTESSIQKKELADMKTSLAEISKDVTSLKDYSMSAMRESQSSIVTQTSDLSKELQTLKGRFDENKYFMDKSIKDLLSERELQQAKIAGLENELKELKTKLASLLTEKKEPLETAAANKEAAPSQPEAKTESPEISGPQKLYDSAQTDFKEKRYGEARQKFEKFSKDFQKHTLTPNAYFWTGESYYAEKKYEDAILAYEAMLKKYPIHDKARGAMLKQAFAFIEIGDKKTGKVLLEKIIEKYPDSHEAELAEKKIGEILPKDSGQPSKKSRKKKK